MRVIYQNKQTKQKQKLKKEVGRREAGVEENYNNTLQ